MTEESGFDSWQEQRHFYLLLSVQTSSGAHLVSCAVDTVGSFPGVKRQEREADNSSPFTAEVNNVGAASLLPHTSSLLN
jgi:hypothetical protein